MGKSIKGTTKKKRGRPATTGKGTQIGMRWQDLQLSAIDAWREKHGVPTRSEAIRRLVETGLNARIEVSVVKPGRRASLPDPVQAAADRAAARSKEAKGK
jgi:hypothetical protein